jgi:hypothetical protein
MQEPHHSRGSLAPLLAFFSETQRETFNLYIASPPTIEKECRG